MVSPPPDESSLLPDGWSWADIGHGALDIAGLVPGYGEAADLTNAAWYLAEDDYLAAGLSIISTIPIGGDLVGKGAKVAGKLGEPALKALSKMVQKMDFGPLLRRAAANPKIAAKIKLVEKALEEWRGEIITRARKLSAPCPKAFANFKTSGWTGNVMSSPVGRKMVAQYEAEGLTRTAARSKAQKAMESGLGEATRAQVKAGDKLYKLSPSGASPTSEFWMTEAQLNSLRGKSPTEIAELLGLPKASLPADGGGFVVQSITAKWNYTGFTSTIAPAVDGSYKAAGGGAQFLVPGRSNFTAATKPVLFR